MSYHKPSLHQYIFHKLDSNNHSHQHQYDQQNSQQQLSKAQTFYQCTQNQQKIWKLFNSLDCPQCNIMYNNKQRRPQIICANNHLLCKSCYSKIRQSSLLCPFCHVRISHKSSTSSHQSIQLFLKIYNQIYQQQKTIMQEKRKRAPSCLDFQLPKNLRTLLFLMLIIVTPWIYDLLKYVVCWLIDIQCRMIEFIYGQVQQLIEIVGMIIEDEFYIGLYTNQKGEYVYYGDSMWQCDLSRQQHLVQNANNKNCEQYVKYSLLLTQKHRLKLLAYSKIINVVGYIYSKLMTLLSTIYSTLRVFMYTLHFLILLVGLIQFPFIIPLILIKLQIFVPKRYIYRIGLYLDVVQPDYEDAQGLMEMEQDVQKLTKFQLYFFLCVRNYMRYVLKVYRSVQVDMKKRCQELQYKRKMRQIKKKQNTKLTKTTGTKTKMRFTFN